jgi:hypothetical protein
MALTAMPRLTYSSAAKEPPLSMYRRVVALVNRGTVLAVGLAVVSFAAPGVTAQIPQTPPGATTHTVRLTLSFDEAWSAVVKGVASSQFSDIQSDPVKRRLVATGEVPKLELFETKRQRRTATVELRNSGRGEYSYSIYDVQVEVSPKDPIKWTPGTGTEVSELIITLSETIARELKRAR